MMNDSILNDITKADQKQTEEQLSKIASTLPK